MSPVLLYGSELAGKRVDVFKQAVPGISRIAVLGAGASPVTRVLWPETQNAVQSLRLEARLFTEHDPAELSATFETIAQDNANGILVAQFCEEDHHRARGEASPARDL